MNYEAFINWMHRIDKAETIGECNAMMTELKELLASGQTDWLGYIQTVMYDVVGRKEYLRRHGQMF